MLGGPKHFDIMEAAISKWVLLEDKREHLDYSETPPMSMKWMEAVLVLCFGERDVLGKQQVRIRKLTSGPLGTKLRIPSIDNAKSA